MLSLVQRTLAKKVVLTGVGLHSGKDMRLELHPADIDFGIQFRRTDLAQSLPIHAHAINIHSTDLNTTISSGDARISTIEHLMAAFAGLEIDNVLVKLDGPEVPVMDGSAGPFVEAILDAGVALQNANKKYFVVREVFELRQGDKWIRVEPATNTSFSMQIDFKSSVIGAQSLNFEWSTVEALESIFVSRTFCHVNDVTAMQRAGLALGGSLDNAIVVSDDEVLNPEGLRFNDEFVRHKLLDCIGDLSMLGAPIIGKFSAYKSGHGLHAAFMKALWAKKSEILTIVEDMQHISRQSPREIDSAAVIGIKS
ncbi:MAG: UDP-3-O-acyl-N-acetylglucosamine deacetylase [Proteobacteria bacterium]|nr:UDP-3-O-acyl-N-acetylglucosamine deacetylase [Pseudomonadota bacterium]